MITPTLEKLILSGKAQFKSFMVGGTEKHILNVSNDRFIIITDLQYFSRFNNQENAHLLTNGKFQQLLSRDLITQCRIFSDKSQNVYSFRNSISCGVVSANQIFVIPFGSTKIDTFLIHESDVSFTFSQGTEIKDVLKIDTSPDVIAYQPPYDYGKGTLPSTIPVREVGLYNTGGAINFKPGGTSQTLNGYSGTLEISYPVEAATQITGLENTDKYPLMIVQYVEIPGNPTNILKTM